MSTIHCDPHGTAGLPLAIPTHTAWWRRLLDLMVLRWGQARASTLQRRQLRALSGLSERTLQDIGMAEQMHWRPRAYKLDDFERGRW